MAVFSNSFVLLATLASCFIAVCESTTNCGAVAGESCCMDNAAEFACSNGLHCLDTRCYALDTNETAICGDVNEPCCGFDEGNICSNGLQCEIALEEHERDVMLCTVIKNEQIASESRAGNEPTNALVIGVIFVVSVVFVVWMMVCGYYFFNSATNPISKTRYSKPEAEESKDETETTQIVTHSVVN
mmetsp:Transcript_43298/g.71539  ORF Transcript_43298/g.71539 Transcript_43298/m.71539 type:complete len:187 (+) Transcript_43298:53-613(+)